MGVLDLLPHAVSGVYFIYHQDFEKWSFGKLSALREAALALEEGYEYYYMGYYIHGCKKMRYKGDYKPQYVLDFHSLEWDEMDESMRELMERRKYASMSQERQRQARALAKASDNQAADGGEEPLAAAAAAEDAEEGLAPIDSVLDEAETIRHPVPLEAFHSGLSILELGMPGVMTLDQLRAEVDLNYMKVWLGRGGVYEMQDIATWRSGSETDGTSIKGTIAEFAAAVGPEIAREIVCDFSRHEA